MAKREYCTWLPQASWFSLHTPPLSQLMSVADQNDPTIAIPCCKALVSAALRQSEFHRVKLTLRPSPCVRVVWSAANSLVLVLLK